MEKKMTFPQWLVENRNNMDEIYCLEKENRADDPSWVVGTLYEEMEAYYQIYLDM